MEELGYHRKYRPKTLGQYVGNDKLKRSVFKALNSVTKPQVILLTGPAGTGKTSMARLLAKEYLCENRDSEKGACNSCYNCQALNEFIETGRNDMLPNIREVDVTDSNKKQDIDELLEEASLPSYDGNWKIYILDECHMMTPSAQNRLLKTLEEPPERVLMILCTTNPEKLLETIISRCQYKFAVTKPSLKELETLLARVCSEETVYYSTKALQMICVKADFVPRKALIELENVVREKGEVLKEGTAEILDMVVETIYFQFFELLVEEPINIQAYVQFLGNLKIKQDIKVFVEGLVSFMARGLYCCNAVKVEGLELNEIENYKKLFSRYPTQDIAYLLGELLRIKNSQDVEANLMLLGYTGIHKIKNNVYSYSSEDIDVTQYTAAEDKKAGDDAFNEATQVTDDDKSKIIESYTREMDFDEITSQFGGHMFIDPNEIK